MEQQRKNEFEALLHTHRAIIFKVANTYAWCEEDRADLAQEIAVQLWRAWPRYDSSRVFTTWMYRIALNVGISFVRQQVRHRNLSVPLEEDLHDAAAVSSTDSRLNDRLE